MRRDHDPEFLAVRALRKALLLQIASRLVSWLALLPLLLAASAAVWVVLRRGSPISLADLLIAAFVLGFFTLLSRVMGKRSMRYQEKARMASAELESVRYKKRAQRGDLSHAVEVTHAGSLELHEAQAHGALSEHQTHTVLDLAAGAEADSEEEVSEAHAEAPVTSKNR